MGASYTCVRVCVCVLQTRPKEDAETDAANAKANEASSAEKEGDPTKRGDDILFGADMDPSALAQLSQGARVGNLTLHSVRSKQHT